LEALSVDRCVSEELLAAISQNAIEVALEEAARIASNKVRRNNACGYNWNKLLLSNRYRATHGKG
jgi:hypothetical protein